MNGARTLGIDPEEYHVWKQKAYNVSLYYLLAVKNGDIEPGTPMMDFIKNQPELTRAPAIVNELMDRFSDEAERLPTSPALTPTEERSPD